MRPLRANVLAQLPTVLESLSGVDLKEIIKELPRLKSSQGEKSGKSKDKDSSGSGSKKG